LHGAAAFLLDEDFPVFEERFAGIFTVVPDGEQLQTFVVPYPEGIL